MDQLSSPSSYESLSAEDGGQGILPSAVGKFVKCGHTLHMLCMLAMYNNGTKVPERQKSYQVYFKFLEGGKKMTRVPLQDGSLQCPSCKTIYGEKTGTQPKGKMEIYSIGQSLPGHPDCGTIHIIYSIPPGIQVRLPDAPNIRDGCFIIHVICEPSSRVRSIPTQASRSPAEASLASASSQTTTKAGR